MKNWIALLLLLLPLLGQAKESCAPASVGLTPKSPLPERLFYTGTCHYRNAEYRQAVHLWIQLANLKKVDARFVELQIDVLNNLGYMMFFGYGIDEDKAKAIAYWKKAVSLGHTESEYHLCHAYADRDSPAYDPPRALPHCRKARLLYASRTLEKDDEKLILQQLNEYMLGLGEPAPSPSAAPEPTH